MKRMSKTNDCAPPFILTIVAAFVLAPFVLPQRFITSSPTSDCRCWWESVLSFSPESRE